LRDCPAEESGGYFLPSDANLAEAIKQLRKRLAEFGRKAGVEGPVLDRLRVTPCAPLEPDTSLQKLCEAIEPSTAISDQPTPEEMET
jgi:hypothetical protein